MTPQYDYEKQRRKTRRQSLIVICVIAVLVLSAGGYCFAAVIR